MNDLILTNTNFGKVLVLRGIIPMIRVSFGTLGSITSQVGKRLTIKNFGAVAIMWAGHFIYSRGLIRTSLSHTLNAMRVSLNRTRIALRTMVLSFLSTKIQEDKRKFFRQLVNNVGTQMKAHSHPLAASERSSARKMIKQYSVLSGDSMYYVSMSTGERETEDGDKMYYFEKDMLTDYKMPHNNADVIALVDVDFYMDLPNEMGRKDYIIYTVDPIKLGGQTANGSYCFENNVYKFIVNSQAIYEHELWNYETDIIFKNTWYGGNLYTVEKRRLTADRVLIFINYRRTVYTPLAWLCFFDKTMVRKHVADDFGFNHQMSISKTGELKHHFSGDGKYFDVELTDGELNNILVRTNYSKNPQLSDVERIIKSTRPSESLESAALIYDYIMKSRMRSKVIVTEGFEDNYQVPTPLITEDGKPTIRRVCKPILDDGYAPNKSFNNDNSCVEGRIVNVKNKVQTFPPFYYTVMQEYLERLIPEPNKIVPLDFEHMDEKFDKPTQQLLIEKFKCFMNYTEPFNVQSFQKSEAYGKINYPRNISTLPMGHNFRLGQFCYSMSEQIFKVQPWYAFGKHPRDVAARVYDIHTNAQTSVPCDISMMDGSQSLLSHHLDIATARRACTIETRGELCELIEKERSVIGYTKHGVKYTADNNTLSGSSRTTIKNTNFIAYCTYLARRLHRETIEQAWQGLGCYGGDDGITVDFSAHLLNVLFAKVGMLSKCENLVPGDCVPFLGRVYVDPWTTPKSFIDVARQLRKLHLSVTNV